jgi:hypothetical protein
MKMMRSLLIAVVGLCIDVVVLPGHFKFKLPDGQTVEVKGFTRDGGETAVIGDCGVYDRAGKLITSGKQGSLKSGPKPTTARLMKSSNNFMTIDDEPTWLPAIITFSVKTGDKGLAPKTDPSGQR